MQKTSSENATVCLECARYVHAILSAVLINLRFLNYNTRWKKLSKIVFLLFVWIIFLRFLELVNWFNYNDKDIQQTLDGVIAPFRVKQRTVQFLNQIS